MKHISFTIRDTVVTIFVLLTATGVSYLLKKYLDINLSDIIAIYTFTVMLISAKTDGYLYGIISSVLSIFLTNYFFTYPYKSINFTLKGYPLTFLFMFIIAITTSTIMTRLKYNAYQAYVNEKKAKELAEQQHKIIVETEKEKMRSNLLRAISHDIRTPLAAISGSATAILDIKNLENINVSELAGSIHEDANWLIHMVENLLAVTRISDDTTQLSEKEEAIEEIVSETIQRIKKTYPHAILEVTVPDEFLFVPMDSILIEQVLFNLIENAIKYAGQNLPVKITVFTAQNSSHKEIVYFKVQDQGKGLSEELLNSVFKYENVSNTEINGMRGMGIGLSICSTIIQAHKGEIFAENSPEGGAVFSFYLPMKQSDAPERK